MIREVVQDEIVAKLDLREQVLSLDAPEDVRFSEPPLRPAPEVTSIVSASVIAQKAKQVDDALYAAVEIGVQEGHGGATSKQAFLRRWAELALEAHNRGDAAATLFAACELGGGELSLPADVAALTREVVRAFLADSTRSAPLGFYTASERLSRIFRQDRMLMTELPDDDATDSLARILGGDAALREAYERLLVVATRMTNPAAPGLRHLLERGAARRILVPSRSHETELVKQLYGDRPIPEGFDLAETLADRVADGALSLAPSASSGWYDHQTWALEPLVAPERTYENDKLRMNAEYRKHLREVFKGLLAMTRETHVKQLEVPAAGCAAQPQPPRLWVEPQLTAEPVATYYARRAQGYRFVRGVLEETFGAAWSELPMSAVAGSYRVAGEAIEAMEATLHGAHVATCRELGLEPDGAVLPDRDADGDEATFRRWVAALDRDGDVSRDSRMMVPVFYDVVRRKTKVWALLGWSERPISIGFARPPTVIEAGLQPAASRFEELRRRMRFSTPVPEVAFRSAYHRVAFPVTVELYVDRLLDREAFRALCDKHRTRRDIVFALGR